MQEIQNTTATYINNSSTNRTSKQNGVNTLFQSFLNNPPSPENISFSEYKNLSDEELESLFGDNKEDLRHAKGLKSTASWTDDDIFNSIIFNMYIDDINHGTDNGKMYFHAQTLTVTTLNTISVDLNNPDTIDQTGINMQNANEMLHFLANIENFVQENAYEDRIQSIDKKRVIEVAQSIVEQYNAKTGENNTILASYTQKNTIPLNSTPENQLFASIIEDNTINYEEIENLTYEQVTRLTNYYMQKDEDGAFIPNSKIKVERKAGMLISSTAITQNENFNKAVFYSIQKIEDKDFLETFMYDITGTQFSDKIIAYPQFQEEKFEEGFSRFITKKIAAYQVKLDNAISEEEKENYQTLVSAFTRLDHMNKSFNNQSIHEEEDNMLERMKALVEDIISVFKTGFTLEELEYIEKLLAEIKKRIKESQENGTNNEEEISKMMKQLERAVAELQKRLTGVAVIETDDDSFQNTDNVSVSTENLGFEARIDVVQKTIEKMKSGQFLEPEITTEKSEEEKEKDKKW